MTSLYNDHNPSPWENFEYKELRCRCGCGKMGMDFKFMDKVQELREELGFSFPITSAYRCPEYNSKVSSTGSEGPHTTGKALDIAVSRQAARLLVGKAISAGFKGIGVSQRGDGRFIHLDDAREISTIWSY